MTEWYEVVVVFLLIILGSIATSWLYRKITLGVVTRKETRSVYRAGKYGGTAKEKIERRK